MPCTGALGSWDGGLKSGPGPLESLTPARGRGSVFASHPLTEVCLPEAGSLPSPEGHHTGRWHPVPRAQCSLSPLRSQQQGHGHSRVGGGASSPVAFAPFLLPDHHTLVERPPSPSFGAALPFSCPPPSQHFADRAFQLQVQKTCSPAHQELSMANTSQNVFWGESGR